MSKSKNGKPSHATEARHRAEDTEACDRLAALLGPVFGFSPTIEPINGYAYQRGGAISLGTIKAMIAQLEGFMDQQQGQTIADVLQAFRMQQAGLKGGR